MRIALNGFDLDLSVLAFRDGGWVRVPCRQVGRRLDGSWHGLDYTLDLDAPAADHVRFRLSFTSTFLTRLRLWLTPVGARDVFHLIPGNIFGDNNAAHVRPGEFPCLTEATPHLRNCAPLWEFRADRASHPVSICCVAGGAVGVSIDPYSSCEAADDGVVRNGVFAALPGSCGVSLGYGNDPLTFSEKTRFLPATADLTRGASCAGAVHAVRGTDRRAAHAVVRSLYARLRERPAHRKTHRQALRALADAFATVNWSPPVRQYTNRKCQVPTDMRFEPWRAIVEIGWTGGSMLAYPLALAERIFPDLKMPKGGAALFDEIAAGVNPASGFLNDACVNRSTENRPDGWNASDINGWWSGFLPQTRDNHCAYTNAHAAYYLLKTAALHDRPADHAWVRAALTVLDTAVELQRADGAFGYVFSSRERRVVDWDGFAGCWFVPALVHAWRRTREPRYLQAAERGLAHYAPFVRDLAAWGSPMDTYKSIDSEGNLAFIRGSRLLHEATGQPHYLELLADGANYEYLWRYGFRARPQAPPLKGSNWNSCGGTITSVSNPHVHPMGVVATEDLYYLARHTGDAYHRDRADDGLAWLMNTMELYPDVVGYGRYGVLSERTCPSDGLLAERYYDTDAPASTWWSYNAWAAASAMEALAERVRAVAPDATASTPRARATSP